MPTAVLGALTHRAQKSGGAAPAASARPTAEQKDGIKLPAIALPGRIVALVVTVLLVLVVGGVVITNSPVFAATDVVVKGSEHIPQETVERLVEVPDGSTLFNIDTAAIETALKMNPWVQSVKVDRAFPHTVTITPVEYKVAAIAYITSSDIAWAIDVNGTWIAPLSLSVTVDSDGNVVSSADATQDNGQQDGADQQGSTGQQDSANQKKDSADQASDSTDESKDSADQNKDGADQQDSADQAKDSTKTLTGLDAARALARHDGAVLFTDITADVEPAEGTAVSSEVISAGLEYVNGFSSDFIAQIDDLSLESVDAIAVNLTNGVEVALGEPTEIELKERVIVGLLNKVKGITYIDARTPESPTYRSAPST